MLGSAEAAFAAPATLVFLLGLERAVVAIADQLPKAPLPLSIPRAALREVKPARRALAVA